MSTSSRSLLGKTILFVGTHGFSRSQFATAYLRSKGFWCEPRALNPHRKSQEELTRMAWNRKYPVEWSVASRLKEMGILDHIDFQRKAFTPEDLLNPNHHVICLDYQKHSPIMQGRFPQRWGCVEFWDFPEYTPENIPYFQKRGLLFRQESVLNLLQDKIDRVWGSTGK